VLISILGISELAAHVILAEIGMDMSRFARPRTSSSGLASALGPNHFDARAKEQQKEPSRQTPG